MREVMLTTVDNPFDPFENFEEWYKIDMLFGYNTCALVARIAPAPPDSLPENFGNAIQEAAIDRWCKLLPLTYKKVVREVPDPVYEDEEEIDEEKSYAEYYNNGKATIDSEPIDENEND